MRLSFQPGENPEWADEFVNGDFEYTEAKDGEWGTDKAGTLGIHNECFFPHSDGVCARGNPCVTQKQSDWVAWAAEWLFYVKDMAGLEAMVGSLYLRSEVFWIAQVKDSQHHVVGQVLAVVPPEYFRVGRSGYAPRPDRHTASCSYDKYDRCELDTHVYDVLTLVTLSGRSNLPEFFQGPGGLASSSGDTGGLAERAAEIRNVAPGAGYRAPNLFAGGDRKLRQGWKDIAPEGTIQEIEIPGYWALLKYHMDPHHCELVPVSPKAPRLGPVPGDPPPPDNGGGTPTGRDSDDGMAPAGPPLGVVTAAPGTGPRDGDGMASVSGVRGALA
jgi:hypothetical protein